MKGRLLRWALIFTLSGATSLQIGSCMLDAGRRLGLLMAYDTFIGPLFGDRPDMLPALINMIRSLLPSQETDQQTQ